MNVLKEWVKSLGLAFVLFLVIRTFLVQAFKIPTGSMESTLLVGDFLLVNKLAYGATTPTKLPILGVALPNFHLPGYEAPKKGDIIVFEYPLDRSLDFVKRCVAASGDTVEMRDKILYLNSIPQDEPFAQHSDPVVIREENRRFDPGNFSWQYQYLIDSEKERLRGRYNPTRDNFGPLYVPEGKYFCLGDNRDHSSDSRFWGFVDRSLIKGRPMILYFSWDHEQWLPRFDRIGHIIQ
ncbi:MAG: signal peptidase I [Candidatus Glassbacteria bacterium RIFCSPLOWO2_12_FULL_58_11]|uniref:Signal peptidase I n=2 Tax=Candidatus Glassiibacteriota TaxID=1817805 RepID=A0A1F5YKZ1_9BACT|nr:MAG: signal peptidase I [Candidatus Glassbacteria bacterium GWA2_58_10]OGG00878.1 MAG: signal peptidase I [Candidatus Glassbacteria bacterium RIFCSPLOWO2_12_FULL_58_11]